MSADRAQETVHTFCRYCLATCGIDVTVQDNRITKISADKRNPHSWHDFCARAGPPTSWSNTPGGS